MVSGQTFWHGTKVDRLAFNISQTGILNSSQTQRVLQFNSIDQKSEIFSVVSATAVCLPVSVENLISPYFQYFACRYPWVGLFQKEYPDNLFIDLSNNI